MFHPPGVAAGSFLATERWAFRVRVLLSRARGHRRQPPLANAGTSTELTFGASPSGTSCAKCCRSIENLEGGGCGRDPTSQTWEKKLRLSLQLRPRGRLETRTFRRVRVLGM